MRRSEKYHSRSINQIEPLDKDEFTSEESGTEYLLPNYQSSHNNKSLEVEINNHSPNVGGGTRRRLFPKNATLDSIMSDDSNKNNEPHNILFKHLPAEKNKNSKAKRSVEEGDNMKEFLNVINEVLRERIIEIIEKNVQKEFEEDEMESIIVKRGGIVLGGGLGWRANHIRGEGLSSNNMNNESMSKESERSMDRRSKRFNFVDVSNDHDDVVIRDAEKEDKLSNLENRSDEFVKVDSGEIKEMRIEEAVGGGADWNVIADRSMETIKIIKSNLNYDSMYNVVDIINTIMRCTYRSTFSTLQHHAPTSLDGLIHRYAHYAYLRHTVNAMRVLHSNMHSVHVMYDVEHRMQRGSGRIAFEMIRRRGVDRYRVMRRMIFDLGRSYRDLVFHTFLKLRSHKERSIIFDRSKAATSLINLLSSATMNRKSWVLNRFESIKSSQRKSQKIKSSLDLINHLENALKTRSKKPAFHRIFLLDKTAHLFEFINSLLLKRAFLKITISATAKSSSLSKIVKMSTLLNKRNVLSSLASLVKGTKNMRYIMAMIYSKFRYEKYIVLFKLLHNMTITTLSSKYSHLSMVGRLREICDRRKRGVLGILKKHAGRKDYVSVMVVVMLDRLSRVYERNMRSLYDKFNNGSCGRYLIQVLHRVLQIRQIKFSFVVLKYVRTQRLREEDGFDLGREEENGTLMRGREDRAHRLVQSVRILESLFERKNEI